MDLNRWLSAGADAAGGWQDEFGPFEPHPSLAVSDERMAEVFGEFTGRLRDNYPFFHPAYAGQMLKPPHPAAVAGYLTAMLVNPNNHALDGGPATAKMEKEVVAALAAMFGMNTHLGHLTTSGTIANLEALFVARELHPGKGIAYSSEAHYTHGRMCGVLGITGTAVGVDGAGRMDLDELDVLLAKGQVGTVVATAGHDRARRHRPGARRAGRRPAARGAGACRRRVRRVLHAAGRAGRAEGLDAGAVAGHRVLRLGGDRPAQARAAALRLRGGAVRRPRGGPVLPARLPVYLLHLRRPAPRRDQPRVLAGRGSGGRRCG